MQKTSDIVPDCQLAPTSLDEVDYMLASVGFTQTPGTMQFVRENYWEPYNVAVVELAWRRIEALGFEVWVVLQKGAATGNGENFKGIEIRCPN